MRHPDPWFRKSKNAWYVEYRGRQVRLGRHPDGAPAPRKSRNGTWNAPEEIRKAFHELMSADPVALPKPARLTVARLAGLFLESICPYAEPPERPKVRREKNLPCPPLKDHPAYTEKSYWWYRDYLSDFARAFGHLLAKDVRELHVERWLDAHPRWTSSRRCAVTALKRLFSWADKKGVLQPNPVKGVEKPAAVSRARTLSREGRAEILAAIPDEQFRSFVEAMQESGARPSEVARVEAADINLEMGVWVLHRHKSGRKTGRPRVVYMTERLKAIVRPLMAKHPDGPIFRGPRYGRPFGRQGICSRFRRLRKKLPHLKDAIAYAYRHSFATDALVSGVPIAQVAELLGHRSTEMVTRHYGHLADQVQHMRDAARKATGG